MAAVKRLRARREIVANKECSKWREGHPEEVDPQKEIFSVYPHRTRVSTGRSKGRRTLTHSLRNSIARCKLTLNRGNSAASVSDSGICHFCHSNPPDLNSLPLEPVCYCLGLGCSPYSV